ncbi:MAG: BamA/TamA family outer membrane protein [Planctomycetaceae bacterium]|nr:BamA/TamA family outer membrane protein [Planctomycetaceae bacterium]
MNNSSSPAIYRPMKVLLVIFIISFISNPTLCDSMGQAPNTIAKSNANITQPAVAQSSAMDNRIIDSISVMGNVYITKGKIMAAARSRAGQTFTTSQVLEDCKRIANLLGVEFAYYNVEPAGDKVRLTFVIKEKIVIRKLVFKGDKKTKQSKLTEKIGFQRGDYLDKLTASDGAEKLTDYYKSTGFPFVKITCDDSRISEGTLEYTIDTGPKVKIKKTKYDGNGHIKKGELNKVIKSKPKNMLIFQNYYKQAVQDNDLIEIQKAYDKRGYLDTKVTSKLNFIKNRKGVEITFVIEEGKQYDLEKIIFSGNEFLSDANLMSTFRLKKGQFYSNEKADYDKDEILRDYRERGFIDVRALSLRQFVGEDKINAVFDINEGGRYRIDNINIAGNKKVQDKVIRRILDEREFKPGEWYNAHIAQGNGEGQLEKDVKGSVYSETAVITPVGDKPGRKDAEVRIKEGKTGSVMFGAGVSSNDGLIGQVIYEQRNFDIKKWPKGWRKFFSEDAFKGAGQTFRITLEPGTEVSRYSVSWTDPYWRDKPISLTVSGSSWERSRESYDESRIRAGVGFTHRLKNGWYRTLDFRAESINISSLDSDVPKEIRDVKGNSMLGGVKTGFGRNTTDSKYLPTKGKNYELSYEQVAGDFTFGVVEGTYRWYKTLREDIARRKTVLETKLYAGSIVGDAPVFEKFYAGGTGSLRGFKYRGVSPRKGPDDDPIGSQWIVTASSELQVPMYSDNLAGLLFVDTGMIETGGIRASVGIGVQIMIPQWFGPVPMRFELAAPFMKDGDDDTQIFSFSAGALF